MNIAFLYEHPSWSDSLIQTFRSSGIHLKPINMADLVFCPDDGPPDFDFAINRVNIMPSAGRNPSVVFHTLHYLTWLETMGVEVINGSRAHFAGASKAIQNGLFSGLGLHCPRSVAVCEAKDILNTADAIGFPLIIKPNIGGSGSGITRYDSREELADAVLAGTLDLGIDGTGLVQEYIRSDGYVYRVEVLGNRLFYSIKQKMMEETFNYCAADGCSVDRPLEADDSFDYCALNRAPAIQRFEPDDRIVSQVISIIKSAGADLGGVEYLVDVNTGNPCFYDFNPYSNFVANGRELLGFSPEQRFVDFVTTACSRRISERSR